LKRGGGGEKRGANMRFTFHVVAFLSGLGVMTAANERKKNHEREKKEKKKLPGTLEWQSRQ